MSIQFNSALSSTGRITAPSFTGSLFGTASHVKVSGSGITVNWDGDLLQLTSSASPVQNASQVFISQSSPGLQPSGALWWNSIDGNLYVQAEGPSGSSFVAATSTIVGGAANAVSASYTLTASYFLTSSVTSASLAQTASFLLGSVTSASYAVTSSHALTASVISNTETPTLIFAENSSGQSILNGSTTIVTNWTNISTLNAAEWNAAAGTFTATKAGLYLVSAALTYAPRASSNFGDEINVQIQKNGTILSVGANYTETGNSIRRGTVNTMAYIPLAAGDVITIRTYQITGGTGNLTTPGYFNTLTIQEIPSRILR